MAKLSVLSWIGMPPLSCSATRRHHGRAASAPARLPTNTPTGFSRPSPKPSKREPTATNCSANFGICPPAQGSPTAVASPAAAAGRPRRVGPGPAATGGRYPARPGAEPQPDQGHLRSALAQGPRPTAPPLAIGCAPPSIKPAACSPPWTPWPARVPDDGPGRDLLSPSTVPGRRGTGQHGLAVVPAQRGSYGGHLETGVDAVHGAELCLHRRRHRPAKGVGRGGRRAPPAGPAAFGAGAGPLPHRPGGPACLGPAVEARRGLLGRGRGADRKVVAAHSKGRDGRGPAARARVAWNVWPRPWRGTMAAGPPGSGRDRR